MAGGGSISDDLANCEPPAKKTKAQRSSSIVDILQRAPSESEKVPCPACGVAVSLNCINRHLDEDCNVIEQPSPIASNSEQHDNFFTEKTNHELSRRFTERLDPGTSHQFGDKLKGLVVNRRASRSFKSSRDRRRRSSVIISEGNSQELHGVQQKLESQSDDIVSINISEEEISSTETLMVSGKEDSVDASLFVANGMLASVSTREMVSERENRLPYYLANFVMVLDTVLCSEDGQLFNDEDLMVVNKFRRLSLGGQKLYVRLFHRNYNWLTLQKVEYSDIDTDLTGFIDELIAEGLLESGDSIDDLYLTLSLVSAPDLRQIAKSMHVSIPNGSSDARPKEQLIQALVTHSTKQRSLLSFTHGGNPASHSSAMANVIRKKVQAVIGRVFRIDKARQAVFERILILFSMTRSLEDDGQSTAGKTEIYNLLQVKTGQIVYPPYIIDRSSLLFATREDLVSYQEALHMEQDFITCMEKGSLHDAEVLYLTSRAMFESCIGSGITDLSQPDFLRCFSRGWVYTRVMNLAVEMLQKLRDYEGAVELLERLLEQKVYCSGKRGYWLDRLALNLDQHLKDTGKALDIISRGLIDDHLRTGHLLALVERARRICQSPSHTEFKHRLPEFPLPYEQEPKEIEINGTVIPDRVTGRKTVFVSSDRSASAEDGDFILSSVEELALEHYCQVEGWERGIHAEGSSFSALFCLLLWDVIFTSGVPNVFRTQYQAAPLDFATDHFYSSRKALIDERLAIISRAASEDLRSMIALTWNSHYGQQCIGMNWDLFPSQLNDAQDLVVCIGGTLAACICERLAKDYRHCRGGVPDLTLWSPKTHRCKFVEVKGPGDRLSQKQVLWLDYLTTSKADAEVCKVKPVGGRRL